MSPFGFLLVIVALAFLWLALIRPQKRRQQSQQDMWDSLEAGDEVVTAGGIYGEITGFRDDDVIVRIAPELEVRVARRAIAGIVGPEEPLEEASAEELDGEREPGATPADARVDGLAEDSARGEESYSEESR